MDQSNNFEFWIFHFSMQSKGQSDKNCINLIGLDRILNIILCNTQQLNAYYKPIVACILVLRMAKSTSRSKFGLSSFGHK